MAAHVQRSVRFYSDRPDYHVIQVGTTLYKLDPTALGRSSDFLKDLFLAPGPGGALQASSDENPIAMVPSVKEAVFEAFVLLAYGRPMTPAQYPKGALAVPMLMELLQLGDYLLSYSTREHALSIVKEYRFSFPPALLIHICFKYGTKMFFDNAFHKLAMGSLRDLTPQDVEWLDLSVYSALARLMEGMQEHRRILAAEPPEFDKKGIVGPPHKLDCKDNARCAEDWGRTWWNGMARFLLDGKSTLTYTECMDQFKRLDFGDMNAGCRYAMFDFVSSEAGNKAGYAMLAKVTAEQMKRIQVVEPDDAPVFD
ncbi:hypothetical protein DFH06DRAFT_1332723 [Mycena polygramma]|nr:hypothetical protein DFH06DRAFT_1332723 [Mycena polygramma]